MPTFTRHDCIQVAANTAVNKAFNVAFATGIDIIMYTVQMRHYTGALEERNSHIKTLNQTQTYLIYHIQPMKHQQMKLQFQYPSFKI
jgi:hypothetical protein